MRTHDTLQLAWLRALFATPLVDQTLAPHFDPPTLAIDRHRRARLVQRAIEALPVTSALALGSGSTWAQLEAFIDSRHFDEVLGRRAALTPAFASYVLELASSPLHAAITAVELAVQGISRRWHPRQPLDSGTHLRLSRSRVVFVANPTVNDTYWALRERVHRLGESELLAALLALPETPEAELFADALKIPLKSPPPVEPVSYLFTLSQQGASSESLNEDLSALLHRLEGETGVSEVRAFLNALGLDAAETDELLVSLVQDGLIEYVVRESGTRQL